MSFKRMSEGYACREYCHIVDAHIRDAYAELDRLNSEIKAYENFRRTVTCLFDNYIGTKQYTRLEQELAYQALTDAIGITGCAQEGG